MMTLTRCHLHHRRIVSESARPGTKECLHCTLSASAAAVKRVWNCAPQSQHDACLVGIGPQHRPRLQLR